MQIKFFKKLMFFSLIFISQANICGEIEKSQDEKTVFPRQENRCFKTAIDVLFVSCAFVPAITISIIRRVNRKLQANK